MGVSDDMIASEAKCSPLDEVSHQYLLNVLFLRVLLLVLL
jgi:hypothetical protein